MKAAVVFAVTGCATGLDVHPERVAMMKVIENTPGVLWKPEAHARFAAKAPGAYRDMKGLFDDQKSFIEAQISHGEVERAPPADVKLASEMPSEFDSATNWPECAKVIGDIRDQSMCGCCWAFAGAEAGSDRMCIATQGRLKVSLSAQDACFNGGGMMSQGCDGGMIAAPWKYLQKPSSAVQFHAHGIVSGGGFEGSEAFGSGLCSDFSMPHCHHHGPIGNDPYPEEGTADCPVQITPSGPTTCDSTAQGPHNNFQADKYFFHGSILSFSGEEQIQQALMAGGPMSVAFTVYEDFELYGSGIYHHVTGEQAGGHAVKLVGFGEDEGVKYWRIANSWNPYWGEEGYFRIRRGVDECGIEDTGMAAHPRATWTWAGDQAEASFVV